MKTRYERYKVVYVDRELYEKVQEKFKYPVSQLIKELLKEYLGE